jgi:hypothetical protein
MRITVGINFLTELFKNGKSYSTINSARSALSQTVQLIDEPANIDFGKHPLTVQFMKGIFKLRPALPKHQQTWDVGIVLNHLKTVDNNLSFLKQLTYKCATLIALSSGHRVRSLGAMDISLCSNDGNVIVCQFTKVLKTTRPGYHTVLKICRFNIDEAYIDIYIEGTRDLRQDISQLCISFQKPHKGVTTQSISRWICDCIHNAGVPNSFSAHSTRAASSSKAASRTDIDIILKAAGWSNAHTFARFYKKPIINQNDTFTHAVLS